MRGESRTSDSLHAVGALDELAGLEPFRVWDGVVARAVDGERVGFAVVELEPSTVVPEHSHENEQLGIVLRGSVSFRVGDEVRDLEAGGTWRIPPNVPHEVHAGQEGAVVLDVFSPVREDWKALERLGSQAPLWP
jgi:quercetin dioxygenase-like cupin family protein